MKKASIEQILRDTETGYNLVAEKFSQTRRHFWRGFEFITNYVKDSDQVLDFGCGNGRLLDLLSAKVEPSRYTGVDVSQNLINSGKNKYPDYNFQKISGSEILPFPDNYFNVVYSIAVFHHLPSYDYRLQTARELYRVTKPGGHIIITVWNLWQKNYINNLFKNWINKIIQKSDLDWNDIYLAFRDNKGRVFNRYHHVFTKGELKKMFFQAGFKVIECDIINSKNIFLTAQK